VPRGRGTARLPADFRADAAVLTQKQINLGVQLGTSVRKDGFQMTMRLVMAVVGFTGVSLAGYTVNNGSFEDLAEFRSGGAGGMTGGGFSSSGRTGLASVDGSRGAKFVSIEPKEPAPETPEKSLRDRILEAMGIHTGPDPREGDTLDALKMRQKDDMGELTVRDIGIEAKIKDVITEIDKTDF
jgi:hypothetical protein